MAKGKIFEYAVLFHPKTKKDAAGNPLEEKKSLIVTDVTRVIAGSEAEVAMLAARSLPEEYTDKLDDIQICIRAF